MQGGRSQADVGDEELDAKDDEKTLHGQKGQRARTAHRKHEVKRGSAGQGRDQSDQSPQAQVSNRRAAW